MIARSFLSHPSISLCPQPSSHSRIRRRMRRRACLARLDPAGTGGRRLDSTNIRPRMALAPGRGHGRNRMAACRFVTLLTTEMLSLVAGPSDLRARRFVLSHVQQVSMYVCHVVLGLTLTEIGEAFRRDRTTVAHACRKIEDRRDEGGYDRIVEAIETAVINLLGLVTRPAGRNS